jgi:hypothetical protein
VLHLSARTSVVRSEHHNPRSGVRKFLATGLEAIFKEFDVTTTAVTALLVLDLVLNDEGFIFEVHGGGKRCRDSMVGSLGLGNEAFFALNKGCLGLLNLPLTDVREGLATDWGLLCRL